MLYNYLNLDVLRRGLSLISTAKIQGRFFAKNQNALRSLLSLLSTHWAGAEKIVALNRTLAIRRKYQSSIFFIRQ